MAVLVALALDAQEEDLGQSLTTWPDCLQNMHRWLSKWCFRSSGASLPFSPSFDEMSGFVADLSLDLLWSLEGLLPEVWVELWVWVNVRNVQRGGIENSMGRGFGLSAEAVLT